MSGDVKPINLTQMHHQPSTSKPQEGPTCCLSRIFEAIRNLFAYICPCLFGRSDEKHTLQKPTLEGRANLLDALDIADEPRPIWPHLSNLDMPNRSLPSLAYKNPLSYLDLAQPSDPKGNLPNLYSNQEINKLRLAWKVKLYSDTPNWGEIWTAIRTSDTALSVKLQREAQSQGKTIEDESFVVIARLELDNLVQVECGSPEELRWKSYQQKAPEATVNPEFNWDAITTT